KSFRYWFYTIWKPLEAASKSLHIGAVKYETCTIIPLNQRRGGSEINFGEMLCNLSYNITLRTTLVGRCKLQHETFIPIVKEFVEALGGSSITDLFPSIKLLPMISGMRAKLERFHHDLDMMLESIIEEHRASNANLGNSDDETDDLLDVLLNLQDHGGLEFPLTTDNIKAVILDMLIAGTETSSTAVEWAMPEMMKNPRILEKAQAEVRQAYDRTGDVNESDLHELKYLKLVIKETLRLHPPLPLLIPRENSERCEINGYEIPAMNKVIVNAWAIGRDSNYWSEAEIFNPERFIDSSVDYKGANFEFIPFGGGRRMCPGMSYGMAVVELSLAKLLYHFHWKLPNGMKNEDLDMTEAFGASFHFPCVPLVTFLIFFFTIVRILKISSKAKKPNHNKLPSGPWKLPLIGNLHQLITSFPHHTLRDLSNKYGDLMQLQLGEVPTVVISSARVAEQVFKTHDTIFSQRPHVLACEVMSYNCKAIIFTPYGNYWKQMRKICTMELLSPTRVQSFQSIRTEEVTDFIKSIALSEGSAINLSEKIFSLSYGITARAAFGKKTKNQEEFIRIIKETTKLSGAICLADMYPSSGVLKLMSGTRIKAEKLHQVSDKILENIVNEHKEKRNKADHQGVEADLVDVLLQLQQQDDLEFPLGNNSIKAVMKVSVNFNFSHWCIVLLNYLTCP
ncbi:hypothetical protein J1N35_004369, partial [Gossypium stocksii]